MKVELTDLANIRLTSARTITESHGDTMTNEEIIEEALRVYGNILMSNELWNSAMAEKAGIVS